MFERIISIPGMPGIRELLSTAPGKATVLSGVNGPLAAVIACETAAQGKKTLIVAENDLKAARLADDIRQLTGGEGSCLPRRRPRRKSTSPRPRPPARRRGRASPRQSARRRP